MAYAVVISVLTIRAPPEDEEVYTFATNAAAWCGTEVNSYVTGTPCNHHSVLYLTEEGAATPAEQSKMTIKMVDHIYLHTMTQLEYCMYLSATNGGDNEIDRSGRNLDLNQCPRYMPYTMRGYLNHRRRYLLPDGDSTV
jgi:hypothetical protein